LKIKPSEEFLKAIEVVEQLGGEAKLPNRSEILDSAPAELSQNKNRLMFSIY